MMATLETSRQRFQSVVPERLLEDPAMTSLKYTAKMAVMMTVVKDEFAKSNRHHDVS